MGKTLVIVESPTKAKTIEKFLGKGYDIKASYGHVRDLPDSASEIPEEIKKEKWTRLGVNIEANFDPLYIIPDQKKKRVAELRKALKDCSELLLATDEDREGESISWHLLEVLKPKKIPVKRLVFHEITKEAIQAALKSPRDVDENLVKAQETRRIVDRLFGYLISPILWKKMAPRLSAGRVQTVALRLLVQRERERISFKAAGFWDLLATFTKSNGESFTAELSQVAGKRIASGKDFDANTGKLDSKSDCLHLLADSAEKLKQRLLKEKAEVSSVEERPYTTKPSAPFATSTLQQEASRKLGFAARRTMSVAQTLYENGFITYMRTDSTSLSEEGLAGARSSVSSEFGNEYLSSEPRIYKTKVKNAQEAHEAIRPASADFAHPNQVKEKLGIEAFKLYELIWKRTLASQMKDVTGTRINVQIMVGDALFKASGKTIEFPGFLRAYVEGSDDPESDMADMEKVLPKLTQGEKLNTSALEALEHITQPPARFTEGSLIKELERLGIGRPSTWATIVDLVLSRTYAFKRGQALVPTFLATAVIGLMERYFTEYVNYEYTARLEDDLDSISRGEADNLKYLKAFYHGNGHPGLKNAIKDGEEKIDPRDVCGIAIGDDETGRKVEVRIGRFGPFISNGEHRAGLPDEFAPEDLNLQKATELLAQAAKGPEALGKHPENGLPVYLKKGRFGPYIQLGDQVEGGDKPKMVSLLPGMSMEGINLEIALKLLEFPRNLGKHPELGADILLYNGRFGPYIKCGEETRSIPLDEFPPLDMTVEQAIELFKRPKTRGRAAAQPKIMRDLGKHPNSELNLVIKSGRYGPYVTDGKINASLARGSDPATLTIEEAVRLLEARAAKIEADPEPKKKTRKKKKKS